MLCGAAEVVVVVVVAVVAVVTVVVGVLVGGVEANVLSVVVVGVVDVAGAVVVSIEVRGAVFTGTALDTTHVGAVVKGELKKRDCVDVSFPCNTVVDVVVDAVVGAVVGAGVTEGALLWGGR